MAGNNVSVPTTCPVPAHTLDQGTDGVANVQPTGAGDHGAVSGLFEHEWDLARQALRAANPADLTLINAFESVPAGDPDSEVARLRRRPGSSTPGGTR